MNIVEALNHPQLFSAHFPGASWAPWRVALRALFALPMSPEDLALYTACTGRISPPKKQFREAAFICGRRGGKSRMLALIGVWIGACIDHAPYLAAGEIATVALIAADRYQARVMLRYILGLLHGSPTLEAMIVAETRSSVTLSNRCIIEVHTASFKVTRGYSLAAVLADETAFWPPEDSAQPDVEIMRAVRPGLLTLPYSMLLLASSPYAKRGVLWETYRKHYGRDDSSVLVWRASTEQMNPAIDPAMIALAREEDPEAAASEFDAQFRSDIAAFVSADIVDACVIPGRFELPPRDGINYEAFVDPSGGSADAFTLAIAHRSGETGVLDLVREVRPPFSPDRVVEDFAHLLKSYGIQRVTGDAYAGAWPPERFSQHGITYEHAEKPKSQIYGEALPLLNSRRVELLDHPRLRSQLIGLERRTSRSGRDSIDHAPGAHDDLANAAAGVLVRVAGALTTLAVWERLGLGEG